MLTDDPGTPGNGMWEINLLSTLTQGRHGRLLEAANVDLNYGLGNHVQLKFEVPWLRLKEAGEEAKSGSGSSMLGIKWRFLNEERNGLDASIYPQVEFNNPARSVERGLVDRGWRLFLPVEAAKKFGPVEVNGEVGYRFVQFGPDEWDYGLLFARQVTRRIELMAELHGSALRTFKEHELFFNAGAHIRLTKKAVLLISAGRTMGNAVGEGPRNIAAFGIQFHFRNRMLLFARNK